MLLCYNAAVMRTALRLFIPPALLGAAIAAVSVIAYYADSTPDGSNAAGEFFVVGVAFVALGLLAAAIYGIVRFVRWAVKR